MANPNRYYKQWSDNRRKRAIEYLGGVCVRCGATEQLQFDHKNSKEKSYAIARNLNRRWEVLVIELDKCQLLCYPCHRKKSIECGETGGGWNKIDGIPHGTLTGYWKGCRQECCSSVRREYRRKYYQQRGL